MTSILHTVSEVAKQLGITRQAVHSRLKYRGIKPERLSKTFIITEEQLKFLLPSKEEYENTQVRPDTD